MIPYPVRCDQTIGWLQRLDASARRRHIYYVLTPTYLAYFLSEDHAEINEQGFMFGNADNSKLDEMENHGARMELADVLKIELLDSEGGEPVLKLLLREGCPCAPEDLAPTDGGPPALQLVCANTDIAAGWQAAIEAQAVTAGELEVPPRSMSVARFVEGSSVFGSGYANGNEATAASTAAPGSDGGGGASAYARSSSGGGGGGLFSRGRSLLSKVGLGGGSREPARTDDEYICLDWWTARSIDLQAKANAQFLADEENRPAAVLHGWLTKRNKSGVRTGIGERERYFVLTPSHLCFFPEERIACVVEGYLFGRAEGTKPGMFGRTGGRLPLESVCEVRLLSEGGPKGGAAASRRAALRSRERRSSTRGKDGDGQGDEGVEDESDGDESAAVHSSGGGANALFEVDFGDVALVCNAHNPRARAAWVKGIRRWSAWRKKSVDEAMFSNLSEAMRAREPEPSESDDE